MTVINAIVDGKSGSSLLNCVSIRKIGEIYMHKSLAMIITTVLLTVSCVSQNLPNENRQLPVDVGTYQTSPDGHNSRNALDWEGAYSGVLPCADCEGIDTTINLHMDGTFERAVRYLGKESATRTDTGTFSWDATGTRISLNSDTQEVMNIQVGENRLFHLDQDGRRIEGALSAHYILHKHRHDPAIEDKHWKLIELNGKPVNTDRDAVLILRASDSVASGNTSCNSFFGAYAITDHQRIHFKDPMAATLMACADMTVEPAFFRVLQMADSYSVSDDGQLSLNRARMAPLARFDQVPEN